MDQRVLQDRSARRVRKDPLALLALLDLRASKGCLGTTARWGPLDLKVLRDHRVQWGLRDMSAPKGHKDRLALKGLRGFRDRKALPQPPCHLTRQATRLPAPEHL